MHRWRTSIAARLRRSPFVAAMAKLSGASLISGALGIGAIPLISRMYSPAEFGVLGVFSAALSVVSVLATLRYDFAIPAALDDADAAAILVVALCAVLGTSILCALAIVTGISGAVMPTSRDQAGILAWALPAGMVGVGTYSALANWMVRRRDYTTLGQTRITQAFSMVGCQLGLGLLGAGSVGLIIGQIAGSSAGVTRLSRQLSKYDRPLFKKLRDYRLRETAWRYRQFPLISGPAVLLDALTGALPTLVIASRFGPAAAGILYIVQRVVMAPMSILTTNFGQIIFGELAELRRAKSALMMEIFFRRLKQIALVGLVVTVGMIVVVPFVLPAALGARWEKASTFFLILSPMIFASFVAAPFGFVTDILRRQDLHFLRDTLRVCALVGALAIAQANNSDTLQTLALISAAGCANALIYLSISWYALRNASSLFSLDSDAEMPAAIALTDSRDHA